MLLPLPLQGSFADTEEVRLLGLSVPRGGLPFQWEVASACNTGTGHTPHS